MRQVLEKLESIELRIKELAEQHAATKKQNADLLSQNIQLKKDLDQLKGERQELDQTLSEALQQAKHKKAGEKERLKMKKELGQYIHEIDKCIQLMQEIS